MYDPSIGRWTAEDPIGFAGKDSNLYRYAGNEPTDLTDPTGLAPVGHHWVPVSALLDPEIKKVLSKEAIQVAMGAYTGGTVPVHGNKTYGGLTHPEYNDLVKEQLRTYIKKNKVRKMTGEQMKALRADLEQ